MVFCFPISDVICSSSSLSLLPACSKIFHGRAKELENITQALLQEEPAHIAILGPGGIGKSTLALASLHHEDIIAKFGTHRYFVTTEGASSSDDLITLIALYFGLMEQGKPLKAIVRSLSLISVPALLILDGLETSWESIQYRSQVEEFLALLADIKNLHLVVSF